MYQTIERVRCSVHYLHVESRCWGATISAGLWILYKRQYCPSSPPVCSISRSVLGNRPSLALYSAPSYLIGTLENDYPSRAMDATKEAQLFTLAAGMLNLTVYSSIQTECSKLFSTIVSNRHAGERLSRQSQRFFKRGLATSRRCRYG